jgi:type I restriction enzyme S subunit
MECIGCKCNRPVAPTEGEPMTPTLPPYPAYKDSGVLWLGQVPEHWDVRRLKTVVDHINEQTTTKTDEDLYIALEHVESWTGRLLPPSGEAHFDGQVKRFQAGDVLFGKLRPYLAKVVRPKQSGVCVGEFLVLRARAAVAPFYLEVVLRSAPAIDFVNSSTYGAKMPRADWAFVGAMLFPVPPLPEQTAIVRLLDYMDRRIRRSIRAKQKLIKLLEEYRQALIHQAVTGKIDVRTGKPYPAYKDSGVPWLGKVPEHWEVRRLKTAVDHVNQQTTTKTDEDLYIALEHVESWTGRLLPPSGEAHFDGQVKRFQAGDVLFGKLRPYLAKVVRPEQNGVCVGEFLVLRAMTILSPLYLEVVLRSAPAIDFMNSSTYGAKMPRVEWTFVGAMLFPVPPLPEQTAIVEYLDAQTAKLDTAIAAARREIELLREYRERLIADVVTGKVDVRGVAAQLPEEPPEEEAGTEEEEPVAEELATVDSQEEANGEE